MLFKWVDYCEKYEAEIESWTGDESIRRFVTDDGMKEEHQYYMSQAEWTHNKNYFCKVILENSAVIAVIIVLATEGYPVAVNPIIVNPSLRNKGYCTKIIGELIHNASEIMGFERAIFEAGIDIDNKPSIKAFENSGFVLAGIHKSGDFTYWTYPASELENYRKYSIDSFEKAGYGGKFIVASEL